MKILSFACVLGLAAIGCGESGNVAGALATLRAHVDQPQIAADPRFKQFASRDEAFTWAAGFEQLYAAATGIAPRKIIPHSDPRYAQAEQLVAQAWTGYGRLYPDVIHDLPAPYVVLLEDATVNAYAVYDDRLHAMPLAFFIQTAAFTPPPGTPAPTPSALLGLVSHELAHLVLLHQYPGVNESRNIHYRLAVGSEELGFLQEDDATLKAPYDDWKALAAWVGDYPLVELNGVPAFAQGHLFDLFKAAIVSKITADSTTPACAQAASERQALSADVSATFDKVNMTWPLDDAGRTQLSQLSGAFVRDATACFAQGPTFAQLVATASGEDPAAVAAHLAHDPDLGPVKDNPNAMAALLTVASTKMAALRELAAHNDYATLRVRTFEEEADDNAMWVPHLIGQDSKGIGEFLTSVLTSQGGDLARCEALIQAGTAPGYGPFSDPHHATCYRIFHVGLFNQLIFSIR
jgi:hypothetical protein